MHFFSDNNNFNNHFSSFVSSSSGDPSKEKEEAEEVKELAAQINFKVLLLKAHVSVAEWIRPGSKGPEFNPSERSSVVKIYNHC